MKAKRGGDEASGLERVVCALLVRLESEMRVALASM